MLLHCIIIVLFLVISDNPVNPTVEEILPENNEFNYHGLIPLLFLCTVSAIKGGVSPVVYTADAQG